MANFKSFLSRYGPKAVAAIVIVVLVFFASSYIGYDIGFEKGAEAQRQADLRVISDEGRLVEADFSVFWEAWGKLKLFHINSEKVGDQDLLYGAIDGLAGSFDDPNTAFFPPADAKKFEEDILGSFGGIGAEIGLVDKQLTIAAPLKGSPAEQAGLESGDSVIKIDGSSTVGIKVDEAVKKIRGPVGSSVVLTIFRKGWEAPKDFTIVRATIVVPTLDYSMLANKIGYIQLYSFNDNAARDFFEASFSLLLAGANGLILDLRNNPGGFLEVANYITGWFVERGDIIVSERFKSGEDRVFRANGNGALKNLPVVVLINYGSASASEILAGALHDLRKAKLVGEPSFGKATVQEVNQLSDGSSLKITVAHWVLPSGKVLAEGLVPDVEVKLTDEDREAKRDPQLDKAIEVLKEELGVKKVAAQLNF